MPVTINAAVEGPTDEALVRRLIAHVGAQPGTVYGMQGKNHLRQKIRGYNSAARYSPWLVLADLDWGPACAPELRQRWLPSSAPLLCLQFAVRAIEAWLIADAQKLAYFLQVAAQSIPPQPESLSDPKQMMVDLARHSRSRAIREDMAPRQGSGRRVGPAYTSRLIEFINQHWRPDIAAPRARSLDQTLQCLRRLISSHA